MLWGSSFLHTIPTYIKSERFWMVFKLGGLLQLQLHVLQVLFCSPKFRKLTYFCHKADGPSTSLPPKTLSPPKTSGSSKKSALLDSAMERMLLLASRLLNRKVLGADWQISFPKPRPNTACYYATITTGSRWNYSQWPTETPHNVPSRITSGAPFPHPLQKMASGPQAFPSLGPVATSSLLTERS